MKGTLLSFSCDLWFEFIQHLESLKNDEWTQLNRLFLPSLGILSLLFEERILVESIRKGKDKNTKNYEVKILDGGNLSKKVNWKEK